MLTLGFGVAAGLELFVWKWWNTVTLSLSLGFGLKRTLNAAYWLLFVSFMGSTVISGCLWTCDLGSVSQLQKACGIMYFLAFALIVQVAAFAFVYTPIVMQRARRQLGFLKTFGRIGCLVVPLTILIVVVHLAVMHHFEAIMKAAVSPKGVNP